MTKHHQKDQSLQRPWQGVVLLVLLLPGVIGRIVSFVSEITWMSVVIIQSFHGSGSEVLLSQWLLMLLFLFMLPLFFIFVHISVIYGLWKGKYFAPRMTLFLVLLGIPSLIDILQEGLAQGIAWWHMLYALVTIVLLGLSIDILQHPYYTKPEKNTTQTSSLPS